MTWHKLGLIFSPSGQGGWMNTHAQVPTPLLCDGFIRVYFSSRPERKISLTSFVDLDLDDPTKILRLHQDPILELGKPGTFDEHGIMPSCAVHHNGMVYLYYSGWSRGNAVPYSNSTGLAISEDGGVTFRKISEGPIIGKSIYDPYSATSPFVLKENDVWHMWYCSGTGWIVVEDKYEHVYDIKYAQSNDGIQWNIQNQPAISQSNDNEALTRPWAIKLGNKYLMWFCYRGSHHFRDGEEAYRNGFAWSEDKVHWSRSNSDYILEPSLTGWDSTMVAYPAVLNVNERLYMFYNGKDFGAAGFGVAVFPS